VTEEMTKVPPTDGVYLFELGMLDNFNGTQGKLVSPCRTIMFHIHIGIGLNLTSFNTAHQMGLFEQRVCDSHYASFVVRHVKVCHSYRHEDHASFIKHFQLARWGAKWDINPSSGNWKQPEALN
jgi:hypothetical protein